MLSPKMVIFREWRRRQIMIELGNSLFAKHEFPVLVCLFYLVDLFCLFEVQVRHFWIKVPKTSTETAENLQKRKK